MRVLTVRQPWAWAILHGGKDVENRSRKLAGDYRGPIAIHAALGKTAALTDAQERLLLDHDIDGLIGAWLGGEPVLGGAIVGVVDLVDVHGAIGYWDRDNRWHLGCCETPWAETGFEHASGLADQLPVHLVLANPRPLTEPIPFKGGLGLRKLTPDIINLIEGV
ncbi:hypothetical protein [Pseudoclavibacter sp. VKM Ac-2888]|uniref:hypothetical protein n=1 Tax=Pseudoclavibacter sp. VKM Ac-2888 TaxID=2783830 RepID=UPI00188C962C|nr:hypothetical protein [Pseudoclavibacter sp. VKM Ac-2888]MBF4549250.1 hypothetical protein [Pseudoclavibacter sp. VKM Ac-2888]